jgi:hypothetical protein
MSYVFESKRDLLYHQNYLILRQAIENAGGDGERVLKDLAEGLLDTLARNEIKLNAEYIGNRDQE